MKIWQLVLAAMVLFSGSGADSKEINDQWTVAFSERFRFLSWDNAISLADSARAARTFTRHRTSLSAGWTPAPEVTFGVKLTNEFRYYFVPEGTEFHLDEVFVDQLYAKVIKPGGYPVTVTMGRQNIMLGEGFIVMAGHPLDGSRSIYFNAVRADWTVRPDHLLTAFYSYQTETEEWLPTIHEQDQALLEQPEEGLGLYYTGKVKGLDLQAYVIRKAVDGNDAYPVPSEINTVGARVKYPLRRAVDGVVEGAYQFGTRDGSDRRAFGGYTYLDYRCGWHEIFPLLPSSLRLGGIYLSGDDPSTDEWEDWDPMFARWPKWSESYIYTQIREDAVAYWTNLASLNAAADIAFSPQVNVRFDYHHLIAPQGSDPDSPFPGGGGTVRGELLIGKLTYRFDRYWSGHILWEGFLPGDYYFEQADDYSWLRTELLFRF